MRRASRLAAAFLWAAALGGCPSEEARPSKDGGAPSQPPPGHAGVKVPLPEGWSARATPDGVLRVGPPGRDVLRIEVRPGQADELPSADALAREFQASLQAVESRLVDAQNRDDASISLFRLSRHIKDGGTRLDFALVGAKRAGGDLFLCSTAPGASEEEVKAAAAACEKLAYAAP